MAMGYIIRTTVGHTGMQVNVSFGASCSEALSFFLDCMTTHLTASARTIYKKKKGKNRCSEVF